MAGHGDGSHFPIPEARFSMASRIALFGETPSRCSKFPPTRYICAIMW